MSPAPYDYDRPFPRACPGLPHTKAQGYERVCQQDALQFALHPTLKDCQVPLDRAKGFYCTYISVVDHEFDTPVVTQTQSEFLNKATGISLSPRLLDIVRSEAARI